MLISITFEKINIIHLLTPLKYQTKENINVGFRIKKVASQVRIW